MSTSDAIAQLNSMSEAENTKKEKKLTPEEKIELQKKEKAMKKLSKLSNSIQSADMALSDAHFKAFKMIDANPALKSLGYELDSKLVSKASQHVSLISTAFRALNEGNLSADEINALVKSLNEANEQLQKDW